VSADPNSSLYGIGMAKALRRYCSDPAQLSLTRAAEVLIIGQDFLGQCFANWPVLDWGQLAGGRDSNPLKHRARLTFP